jgi:hypothetical protein
MSKPGLADEFPDYGGFRTIFKVSGGFLNAPTSSLKRILEGFLKDL